MFDKINETVLEDYHAVGTLYKHRESGLEAFHVKNDSKELTCCFMFATPSRDDTGVAHILEHTVLCGSGNYPVKDPFSQVLISSPNTFLNAMTFTDKTIYPFSSPLKKDFDILFDIYADAVFNPLLRRESFEQEGVRFFGDSFDGVVYNEMTGAMSSADDIAQSRCMRKLYEGTPFKYESGGDPLYIADLTYEEYKARYRSWYSPSNCRLFLFGDLDPQEYFDKLEKLYLFPRNLSKWEGTRFDTSISGYTMPEAEPLKDSATCPQPTSSSVILTWLTQPAEDPLEQLTITVLTDILLGNPGAPLYKAITDSGLGEDLSPLSGTDPDFPLMPFIAGFTGAEAAKSDEIEAFLLNTLRTIAKDGIDPDQVTAAIKRQDFRLQEQTGGSEPLGILVAMKAARTWMRSKGPQEALQTGVCLKQLKERIAQGRYFETWIEKNLIDNPRRCLLTVSYDQSYNARLKSALDEKLKNRVSAISNGDFEKLKADFNAFIAKEDSPEALASIPRISLNDMPCILPHYETQNVAVQGVPVMEYPLATNGIIYFNMSFNTLGLSVEDKKLLPLLMRVMQMTGTDLYDYVKLGTLIKNLTGSFSINPSCGRKTDGNMVSDVVVQTKVLKEDLDEALALVSNILLQGNVSDKDRVKASLTDLITDFEMNYTYSASSFATLYACSQFSSSALETDMTSGTSAWLYLKELKEQFNTQADAICSRLADLRDRIFTRKGMFVLVGCDEALVNQTVGSLENFIGSFPEGQTLAVSDFYAQVPQAKPGRAVLTLSSGPAYNAMSFPVDRLDEKQLVDALLFSSIISSGYLWETVRGKNGAYGVYCTTELQEKVCSFVSYRDPLTEPTYQAYLDSFKTDISKEEIEYSVVTIVGKELKPLSAQQKCNEVFKRFRYGLSEDLYLERRMRLVNVTVQDLKTIAEKLEECCRHENHQVSIGGAQVAATNKAEGCYTIKLPL